MAIAVVGGGIAGASAAYHLAHTTDQSITVYERGELAGETTAKSGALFGDYGSPVERRMKHYGRQLYNDFLAAPRAAPRHEYIGRLKVATTASGASELESIAAHDHDTGDQFARYLPGDALEEQVFLPDVDTDPITGAIYRPHVGYLRPREMALEFIARARDNNVRVDANTTVDRLIVDNDQVTGIERDGLVESVDAVVCAAGPWNPHLLDPIDLDLPVTHSRAPILKLTHDSTHTLPNIAKTESGTYLIGRTDDTVLLGHYPTEPPTDTFDDPGQVPNELDENRRQTLRDDASSLVPALADAGVQNEWVGIRSHTPDGDPIVGWTPIEGLAIIAFNSSGIQLAPAAGYIIANQLGNGDPTEYYPATGLDRFDKYTAHRTTLTNR